MKKLVIILAIMIVSIVGIVFAVMKNLHYSNEIELDGASHRIVVVVNPQSITGGTIILNEQYTLTGTKSKIHASVFVNVE